MRRHAVALAALACLSLLGSAGAESSTQPSALDSVTVTGVRDPVIGVAGFGDVPLSRAPFQAASYSAERLRDAGAGRLSDITRLDASVSDAYNTTGYWDYLTVRGFVIDNLYNYRRDGLPINAETSLPLGNKERVDILKGTSGIQAGTSAPGGLVDLIVKRPTTEPLRKVELDWEQKGSVRGAVDLSQRFGADRAFGLRLNVAAARLDPLVRSARGDSQLFALAGEWRAAPGALLEAEIESSRRSQPSVPGFSLLGGVVPAPVDPRINLNNQPWSLPVVLKGNTASIRWSQDLAPGWRWSAHAATQRLRSDDRIAFPFGCSAENDFSRYCRDGSYDLYDFRSDGERRRTDALQLALDGHLQTGPVAHTLSLGVLRSQLRYRFNGQAYNYVGSGNVEGTAFTGPDPTLAYENTNRDETSTELFVRDAARLTESLTAWFGLRHTRLARESVGTAGSEPTSYSQSFTTPWLGLSQALTPTVIAYASWGRGVESEVAPNRPEYTNAGIALPARRSRQAELGIKGSAGDADWTVAWFDIVQPQSADLPIPSGGCQVAPDSCVERVAQGTARHRGIDASAGWRGGPWTLQGSVMWLHARREGSGDPTIDGRRPTNVPAATLKLQGRYDTAWVPGLTLLADLTAEGDRMVLEDNSLRVPGYARWDLGARYVQPIGTGRLVWRAGLDNALDRRAWRESPLQFGHVYLFPLPPRTLRLSVEASL